MRTDVIEQLLCFDVFQISSLKSRLKKVSTMTGDGVARAFLKSQAALFGSYRNALQIESVSRWRTPVFSTSNINNYCVNNIIKNGTWDNIRSILSSAMSQCQRS